MWKIRKSDALEQIMKRQPLPLGRKEFHEWADRIIALAFIPGATVESQKFMLADMIVHLGPTESHKEDAFFIHSMRKCAANQVAHAMRVEIRDAEKARLAAEEAAKTPGEVPPENKETDESKILANS
jgi:hypothetical protein